MSMFGSKLKQILAEHGMSQNAFSKAVGGSQGHISAIIRGDRPPPTNTTRLESWADALDLQGEDRRQFLLLAVVSRAAPEVQRTVDPNKMVADDVSGYDAGMNHFGCCLKRHMDARGMTAEDLAKEISAKPEVINGYLGGQPPAESDDDPMVKALDLQDLDKMEFLELASITRDVPSPPARDHFVETLNRLLDHERKIRAMREALDP